MTERAAVDFHYGRFDEHLRFGFIQIFDDLFRDRYAVCRIADDNGVHGSAGHQIPHIEQRAKCSDGLGEFCRCDAVRHVDRFQHELVVIAALRLVVGRNKNRCPVDRLPERARLQSQNVESFEDIDFV